MKKELMAGLLVCIMLSSLIAVSGIVAQPQAEMEKIPVIIMFKEKPNTDLINQHHGEIKTVYHIKPALAASLPEKAIDNLKRNPNIAYIVEDKEVFPVETLPWGVDRIDADIVHESNNKGTGVNVAILDTGIDYNHPDLAANYMGGYDFAGRIWQAGKNDKNPMDHDGHGTHCAGIVAAVKGNGIGAIGVAPEAHLYAVKVFDDNGNGVYSDVIEGFEWCIDTHNDTIEGNEIQVISMSFGSSGEFTPLNEWLDDAYEAGIVLVGAAGNDGNFWGSGDNVIYPARYDKVIAVAATDINDNRASFSSTGPDVELAAPGVSIYSTVPGGYATYSGTSMACPHVAGTAALVIASGITDGDGDGKINDGVRVRLRETAEDLGAAGFDTKYGYGLVDAEEAAPQLSDASPVVNITNPADGSTVSGTEVIIEASASDDIGVEKVEYCIDSGAYQTMTYNATGYWEATWDSTSVADGLHTITAKATDTIGQTSTDSIRVIVDNMLPVNVMHVASIEMASDSKSAGKKNIFVWAVATVTTVDEYNHSVAGATVSGHWSDATSDSDSGITDASGQVSLKSNSVKNAEAGTTFTFKVDGVTHADLTWGEESASGSITVP